MPRPKRIKSFELFLKIAVSEGMMPFSLKERIAHARGVSTRKSKEEEGEVRGLGGGSMNCGANGGSRRRTYWQRKKRKKRKKSAKFTVALNGKKWADMGRFELIFAVSRCKRGAAAAMEGCEDSRGTIVAAGSQCKDLLSRIW